MVVDVKRPILSVSRRTEALIHSFKLASLLLRRADGAVVEHSRRGGFVLSADTSCLPSDDAGTGG